MDISYRAVLEANKIKPGVIASLKEEDITDENIFRSLTMEDFLQLPYTSACGWNACAIVAEFSKETLNVYTHILYNKV